MVDRGLTPHGSFDLTKSVKTMFKNIQLKFMEDEVKVKLAASITRREYLPFLWAIDSHVEKNLMLSLELLIHSMLKPFVARQNCYFDEWNDDLKRIQRNQTLSINVDFHVLETAAPSVEKKRTICLITIEMIPKQINPEWLSFVNNSKRADSLFNNCLSQMLI